VPVATLRARRDGWQRARGVDARRPAADSEEEEGNQPPQSSGARLRGMIGGGGYTLGWGRFYKLRDSKLLKMGWFRLSEF